MIKLRPYKESDHDFICSSFLNSSYFNSIDTSTKITSKIIHDKGMNKVINNILQTFDTLVVSVPEDDDLILGYMIHKNDLLFYVYIKQPFRQQGLSKELISKLPKNHIQTLMTSKNMHYITQQLKSWDYNPFI